MVSKRRRVENVMKKDLHTLLRVTYAGLFVFLLVSCQKNLTQIQPTLTHKADSSVFTTASVRIGDVIEIDSSHFSSPGNMPLISIQNSYYQQRIQEKVKRFYEANHYKTKWLREG